MDRVVVYSKPDCHLCDEVKAALARLQATRAFEWREVNILEDRAAYDKFHDQIPVVFINGKKTFKYRLDEKEFLRRLNKTLDMDGTINSCQP